MRRRAVQLDWTRPLLRLYVVADTHVGAEACDERKVGALAARIANDDDALVVGLGDYIEAITIGDYRFDANELAKPIAPEHLSNPLYSASYGSRRAASGRVSLWAIMSVQPWLIRISTPRR